MLILKLENSRIRDGPKINLGYFCRTVEKLSTLKSKLMFANTKRVCGRFAPGMAPTPFKIYIIFNQIIFPIHSIAYPKNPPVCGDPPKATYRSLARSVVASLRVWPQPLLK